MLDESGLHKLDYREVDVDAVYGAVVELLLVDQLADIHKNEVVDGVDKTYVLGDMNEFIRVQKTHLIIVQSYQRLGSV